MNIQNFISIDFYALVDIIDTLNGIEIDINENEVKECNRIIQKSDKMFGGEKTPEVHAGKQLLNGKQALAYARMRYLGNSDFDRTARQRLVLKTTIKKLNQEKSIDLFLKLSGCLSDNVATSLSNRDITRYFFKSLHVSENIHSFSLVNDEHILGADIDGEMSLLPNSLKDLTVDLHRYIYEENYTPTEELIKRSDALHTETNNATTYPLYTGTTVKE